MATQRTVILPSGAVVHLSTATQTVITPSGSIVNLSLVGGGGAVDFLGTSLQGTGVGIGGTPVVTLGNILTALAGTLIGSGQVPVLTVGGSIVLTALTGTGTGVGRVPSLTLDGSVILAALAGTGTGVGQSPSMTLGAFLTALSGTSIGIGQTPSLSLDSGVDLIIPAGTGIGIGQTPIVSLGSFLTALSGTGVGVGQVPSFVVAAVIGGKFNIDEIFPTGSTVTISILDTVTGLAVPIDSNVCPEVGTTGLFLWDVSKLTSPVSGYKEFIYQMTDGITTVTDLIRIPSTHGRSVFRTIF